jgi:DNA-binding PadR family transcriptional regulator
MKNCLPAQSDLVSLAVLSLLVEKPCHPYEMHRLVRERNQSFVTGMPRSLYRAVDRLVDANLIEAAETEREGGRPERTIFRATEDGRAEFYVWLAGLLAGAAPEPSLFNAAISFLPYVSPEVALKTLGHRVALLEAHLRPAEATLRHVGARLPRVYLLEVEHTRVVVQAELDWLLSVLADLESGALAWSVAVASNHQNE